MWNLHWQCCFQSQQGEVFALNIYQREYIGDVVQLQGASSPFVTREDDDEDIFKPVRIQTGYLRIIDNGEVNIEALLPSDNNERLVKLMKGTFIGDWPSGYFSPISDDPVQWQGFIKAQLYTQIATGYNTVLEIPVVSMLGGLETLYVPTGIMSLVPLHGILLEAARAIDPDSSVWDDFSFFSDLYDYSVWFDVYAPNMNFLESVDFISDNNSVKKIEQGISFLEALVIIGKILCVTFREQGSHLHAQMLAFGDIAKGFVVRWSEWDGQSMTLDETFATFDMLNFNFCGKNNTRSIVSGKKSAKVCLDVKYGPLFSLYLPQGPEDTSPTYTLNTDPVGYKSILQPHPQEEKNGVIYTNHQMHVWHDGKYVWCPEAQYLGNTITNITIGSTVSRIQLEDESYHDAERYDVVIYNDSDFIYTGESWQDFYTWPVDYMHQIVNTSVYVAPDIHPYYDPREYPIEPTEPLKTYITLGAVPVRFNIYELSDPSDSLRHGVLMNFYPSASTSGSVANLTLKTPTDHTLFNGFINIAMDWHWFRTLHSWSRQSWHHYLYYKHGNNGDTCELRFQLRIGDMYWNGTQWTQEPSSFPLVLNPSSIENYDETMDVDDIGGYYIPVTSSMTGVVEFSIYNHTVYKSSDSPYADFLDVHTGIVTDFAVTFVRKRNITFTAQNNVYYKPIVDRGYSGNAEVLLSLGTYNNNNSAYNFLVDEIGDYVEQFKDIKGEDIRPEIRLLNWLTKYYKTNRYVWEATVNNTLNYLITKVVYSNRLFWPIVKKNDWWTGKKTITFIESIQETYELEG